MKIEILQRNKLFSCTDLLAPRTRPYGLVRGAKRSVIMFSLYHVMDGQYHLFAECVLGSGVVKRSLKHNF